MKNNLKYIQSTIREGDTIYVYHPAVLSLQYYEKTGYLVPVADRVGFARRTNMLLNDGTLVRRLGEAGRRRMLEHFSIEKMVRRHVVLYREVINGHDCRPTENAL